MRKAKVHQSSKEIERNINKEVDQSRKKGRNKRNRRSRRSRRSRESKADRERRE